MSARNNGHTHDAWVLGTHSVPPDATHFVRAHPRAHVGYVLVHDLDADTWQVVSPAMFARWYQWVSA